MSTTATQYEVFTDNTPMPFGCHKGTALANVPASYLLWLHEKGCDHASMRNYLNENITVIKQQAKRAKSNNCR